jgi:hypothetical protein
MWGRNGDYENITYLNTNKSLLTTKALKHEVFDNLCGLVVKQQCGKIFHIAKIDILYFGLRLGKGITGEAQ